MCVVSAAILLLLLLSLLVLLLLLLLSLLAIVLVLACLKLAAWFVKMVLLASGYVCPGMSEMDFA